MRSLLLVLFLACTGCNAEAVETKKDGYELVLVGGTIRQDQYDNSKWCWIEDVGHKVIGFNSSLCGKADGNTIVLKFGRKFKQVGSVVMGPDETLARDFGLSVGASVSYEFMIIKGSDRYGEADFTQYMANGNIWISGVMIK